MATIQDYNHTRKLFANGEVNLANLKVMLRTGSTFSAAHTEISDLAGSEVSGNGWPAGGAAITGASVTVTGTNGATLDGDDISQDATGGAIGPATEAVIYDDTGDGTVLFYVDFEGTEEAGDGTPFNIIWHENGIHRWTAA